MKFRQDLKLEFGLFFLLMFCKGNVEFGSVVPLAMFKLTNNIFDITTCSEKRTILTWQALLNKIRHIKLFQNDNVQNNDVDQEFANFTRYDSEQQFAVNDPKRRFAENDLEQQFSHLIKDVC